MSSVSASASDDATLSGATPSAAKYRAFMEGSQALTRTGGALRARFGGAFEVFQTRPELFAAGNEAKEVSIDEPLVHFLWENTPKKFNKLLRDDCLAYNHLDNAVIFEDKTSLARLQEIMKCDTLKSFVVRGRTEFLRLAEDILEFDNAAEGTEGSPRTETEKVWVVKDPLANSAEGVWFFDQSNYKQVALFLGLEDAAAAADASSSAEKGQSGRAPSTARPPKSGYAIQRFIANPDLYDGRKYHIRTYNLIMGDLSAYINKRAFLHVANKPYVLPSAKPDGTDSRDAGSAKKAAVFDKEIFLTNCCANKASEAFTGEICIDLQSEKWAAVFARMQVGATWVIFLGVRSQCAPVQLISCMCMRACSTTEKVASIDRCSRTVPEVSKKVRGLWCRVQVLFLLRPNCLRHALFVQRALFRVHRR